MSDLIQKQLELINKHWPETLTKDKAEATNEVVLAIVKELSELTDGYRCLPWKPDVEDREYILEELVDVHHFLLELYLIWGVTSDVEVEKLYLKKREKNLNERGPVHLYPSNKVKEN